MTSVFFNLTRDMPIIIFELFCASENYEFKHNYLLDYLRCVGVIRGRYFNITQGI